jgi:hypothetical protein
MAIINDLELGGAIFNPDNLNPYGYGYNNPVSFDDPDGKCPMCVGALVGMATDYGIQVGINLIQGKSIGDSLTDVDGKQILVAGALGAAGVGLAKNAGKIAQLFKGANKAEKALEKGASVANSAKKAEKIAQAEQKAEKVAKGSNAVSKVEKSKSVEKVGEKFTKTTEVRPSKVSPGQSRAEYTRVKNADGKVIKTYKDSYDRSNKFMHRKPLTGGPEGRT